MESIDFNKEFSYQNVQRLLNDFNLKKPSSAEKKLNPADLASYIDHTILKPEASKDEIVKLCEEAKEYKFASVCVNPSNVKLCAQLLKESEVKVCTVIGFPLGANTTEVKKFETEQTIKNGANEVDMVINIGFLKDGRYDYIFNEISEIVSIAKKYHALCKVIIETALLSDEEKIRACIIAKTAGADFVKTSTGFSKGGATLRDVALLKFIVGDSVKVKASGGIRNFEDAVAMIYNGADRIGTSSGINIITRK